jgi:hypothetical protein
VGHTVFSRCIDDSIKNFHISGRILWIPLPEQVRQSLEMDTVRTKVEKDADYKFSILYWSYLDYNGKKAIYKLRKDKFLSKGLTESYYDIIIYLVDQLNNFQLTDKASREFFDERFPLVKKKWLEEAEKFGLKKKQI